MNALHRDLKRLVALVEQQGAAKAAADPYRQHYHLQPTVGWLNDPNGLCVYGGQYHAFFQYSPFNVNGGVKHWGHAVSTDLLHWTHINTLTTPEPFGYMWECPDLFHIDGQWYLVVSPQGIPCQNVYGCGWFAVQGDWRGEYQLGAFHPAPAADPGSGRRTFADPGGAARSGSAAVPYPRAGTGSGPPLCPDGAAGGRLCSHHCQGGRAGVY